ncbi:Tyrosine-protein kinase wzc [bacterium HR39]|nr:Tyrosine-protein kinase wzc [bacterium HR39]
MSRPRPLDRRPTTIERAAERLGMPRPDPAGPGPVPEGGLREPLRLDRIRLREAGIVAAGGEGAALAELRMLASALLADVRSDPDPRARIVVVTSARPGEGKTWTALDLALLLAADPDLRVILVDADAKRRDASRLLGAGDREGLAELLAGRLDAARAFLAVDVGRLLLVPAGRGSADLAGRLSGERTGRLFGALVSDPRTVVLVDTPPVLASPEAVALAAHAGRVLFVVEAGTTPRAEVERALAPLLRQTRVRLVLNRASAVGRRYDYGPRVPRSLQGGRPAALLLTAALATAPLATASARILVEPRIEAGAAFTDNVRAAPEGREQAGTVLRTAAGVLLRGLGSRLRLAVDAAVEEVAAWADGRLSEFRERVQGALSFELVRRLLFLEAQADLGEETLDAGAPLAAPDFTLAENRTSRGVVTVGPTLRTRIRRAVALELAARASRVSYGDASVADATVRGLRLALEDAGGGRMRWNVTALAERSDLDPTRTEPARRRETALADLALALEIAPGYVVLVGAGYAERRDDTRADRFAGGPALRAGLRAPLAPRLALEADAALRAGDPDVRVAVRARLGPKTTLEAAWRERVANRVLLARESVPTVPLDSAAPPEVVQLVPVPTLPTVVGTDASFQSRRGELRLDHADRRQRVRLLLFAERRGFEDQAEADQDRLGAELAWVRRLSRLSDVELVVALEHIGFDGGGRIDDLSVSAGWIHRLSRHTRLSLGLERVQRSARRRADDMVANVIFARIERRF